MAYLPQFWGEGKCRNRRFARQGKSLSQNNVEFTGSAEIPEIRMSRRTACVKPLWRRSKFPQAGTKLATSLPALAIEAIREVEIDAITQIFCNGLTRSGPALN